jgi:hypothetical protein
MEPTTPRQPQSTPSRRGLLAAGTTGLAATAFLAACSSSEGPRAGLSGAPTPTTEVPPTVPEKAPTQAQLQEDLDMLATANSLELLAAEVYRRHGPDLTIPELAAAAERFLEDHTDAAEVFGADVAEHDGVGEPNEYLLTNLIDPMRSLLTDDEPIADLMSTVESSLAATYITAVGTMLEAGWRQTFAEHAAAAARRAAVWGNGGTGSTPTAALYPLSDLISSAAYLSTAAAEEAAAAEADAEGGETTETTEAGG